MLNLIKNIITFILKYKNEMKFDNKETRPKQNTTSAV